MTVQRFLTAPQLFAAAMGRPCPSGPHRCFFCGAPCATDFARDQRLSGTFTGWGEVVAPTSEYLCGGCFAVTDESDTANRPRFSSWVLTAGAAMKFSPLKFDGPSGIEATCRQCLNPPPPPFVLSVATSGKKHVLYRAPVNHRRDVVVAQLELSQISYAPAELRQAIDVARHVAALFGRPYLKTVPSGGIAGAAELQWPGRGGEIVQRWSELQPRPIGRLAAHFCPPREQCRTELGIP